MSIFRAIKSDPPYYQEVILYYKINPCPSSQPTRTLKDQELKNTCTQQYCFYYHNENEKRRPMFNETTHEFLYEPIPCPSFRTNGRCLEGEKCRYSHTENEVVYHPLYYKTHPCKKCQFDNISKLCPQYHTDEVNRSLVLERLREKKGKENSSRQLNGGEVAPKNVILDTFKTKPCTSKGTHNPKVCAFYHSDQDKRRAPNLYDYSPVLCVSIAKKKTCPHGDNCKLSHNLVEQLYHPDRYKKKFCQNHPHNVQKCKYGNHCSFAHSETEIKIKLLHNFKKDEQFYQTLYKTVFCPYMSEHDRNSCFYAHNPQDFRRDPSQYSYNPIQCPDWSQGQIYTYDEGKCPRGMDCEFCHGWKELDYHPLCYKTKSCNNVRGCKKMDCPNLHGDQRSKENHREDSWGKAVLRETIKPQDKKENSIDVSKNELKLYFWDESQNQASKPINFQFTQNPNFQRKENRNCFNKKGENDLNCLTMKNFNSVNNKGPINKEKCDGAESNNKIAPILGLLHENDLDYVIPNLMFQNSKLERLPCLDFRLLPQIKQEGKEKIAAILSEISTRKAVIQNHFGKNKDCYDQNALKSKQDLKRSARIHNDVYHF